MHREHMVGTVKLIRGGVRRAVGKMVKSPELLDEARGDLAQAKIHKTLGDQLSSTKRE